MRDKIDLRPLVSGQAFKIEGVPGVISKHALLEALAQAAEVFQADCATGGRQGARIAFAAMYGFVKAAVPEIETEPGDLMRPISKLGEALERLDEGVAEEILKPVKKVSKPRGPFEMVLLKATTSAAVTILMEGGGIELKKACRRVAALAQPLSPPPNQGDR